MPPLLLLLLVWPLSDASGAREGSEETHAEEEAAEAEADEEEEEVEEVEEEEVEEEEEEEEGEETLREGGTCPPARSAPRCTPGMSTASTQM